MTERKTKSKKDDLSSSSSSSSYTKKGQKNNEKKEQKKRRPLYGPKPTGNTYQKQGYDIYGPLPSSSSSSSSSTSSSSSDLSAVDGTYEPPVYKVPTDSEGYLQSFTVNQVNEFKQFFNEFGFVIVRDVLTREQSKSTIEEIWDILEEQGNKKVSRFVPSSWDMPNEIFEKGIFRSSGMVGSQAIFRKQAVQNRQNPNIYQVCSALLDSKEILVNQDRYGFFRPTKSIPIDGKRVDRTDWKTRLNLHLDMNPWKYVEDKRATESEELIASLTYEDHADFFVENNEDVGVLSDGQLRIQCLVNLRDNKEEDGGFLIVPGFHRHFVDWTKDRKALRNHFGTQRVFIVLPHSDPIYKHAIRVTSRPGSLIVWDQRMVHGSKPNDSSSPRYAQFFHYTALKDVKMTQERAKLRAKAIRRGIVASGVGENGLTPLGKRLFGLVSWDVK